MRIHALLLSAAILGVPALPALAGVDPGTADLVTPFSITTPTKVPGKTLKPGSYSIRVVDHLSDRVILEVDGPKGKPETKFIGLENAAIRGAAGNGPIPYGVTHGDTALRGFAFPGGSTAEFVYPKEEAVAIAKASTNRVPAIDPASEGRVAANHLSRDDMQMVTLWTLSSTRVGPENASQPAIQAERYQPPAPTPVQYARTPPNTASPAQSLPSQGMRQNTAPSAPQTAFLQEPRVPRLRSQASITSLPHTASHLPLLLLTGLFLLFAATAVRLVRVVGVAR